MATNSFTIGRNTKVIVNHSYAGGRLDIGNVTGFDPKQNTKPVKVDRLDGLMLTQHLPGGWSGTIEFDRRDAAVDQFIAKIETAFRNGVSIPFGQVFEYVTETDGSRTTWLYENAAFHLPNAGKRAADQAVKMSLGFDASWRTAA